jgi:peptidoglycan/LPS O-acetylase OafA/YrhL
MNKLSSRIDTLDGFRAMAIISVMLYHFFSRWAPPLNYSSLYPYGNAYSYFKFGYLGVEFFFIISGFVIYFTLDKTNNFKSFWEKRAIRLIPSMVVASILTFVIFILFDKKFLFPTSHNLLNFFPGVTFISPYIYNQIFNGSYKFEYLNGSYWSLWPEVQFYLLASVVFYLNRKIFIQNIIIISIVLISFNYYAGTYWTHTYFNSNLLLSIINCFYVLRNFFNLVYYLPFFCMGVYFYIFYKNRMLGIKNSIFLKITFLFFVLYAFVSGVLLEVRFIHILMIFIFMIFIYYPRLLFFLIIKFWLRLEYVPIFYISYTKILVF